MALVLFNYIALFVYLVLFVMFGIVSCNFKKNNYRKVLFYSYAVTAVLILPAALGWTLYTILNEKTEDSTIAYLFNIVLNDVTSELELESIENFGIGYE